MTTNWLRMSLYWYTVEPEGISHPAFSSQFVEPVKRGSPGLSPAWTVAWAAVGWSWVGSPSRWLGACWLLPCGHSEVVPCLQQVSYHTRRVGLGWPIHIRSLDHFLEPLSRGQVSPSWPDKPVVGLLCAVWVYLRTLFYKVSQKDETPVINLKYSLLQSIQYLKSRRLFW